MADIDMSMSAQPFVYVQLLTNSGSPPLSGWSASAFLRYALIGKVVCC